MGSRKNTTTATRKEVLERARTGFDQLSTRDAQVLRMRQGISEPPDAEVGGPAEGVSDELRQRLEEIELKILEKALVQMDEGDAKSKILTSLKKKS